MASKHSQASYQRKSSTGNSEGGFKRSSGTSTSQGSSQKAGPSQSCQQMSQNGESSQGAALSPQDIDSLVADTVLYLLAQDHHKHPIKQSDIKKVLKIRSKLYKEVINKAKEVLLQVFGFRLLEIEPDSAKSYILVNSIESSFSPKKEEEPHYVLLLLALSLIFMCGGCVKDDVMWKFLTGLGILQENTPHQYFGDVRKLMTQELVRQHYLKYTCIVESDPLKYEFRWGKRAEVEVSKKMLLEFVGQMFGHSDLSVWTSQFEEIKEEKKSANIRCQK